MAGLTQPEFCQDTTGFRLWLLASRLWLLTTVPWLLTTGLATDYWLLTTGPAWLLSMATGSWLGLAKARSG